jgi:hypothetical protein
MQERDLSKVRTQGVYFPILESVSVSQSVLS